MSKGSWQRRQAEDDSIVTANWSRIAGHADGCRVTKEWKPSMTCCGGRDSNEAKPFRQPEKESKESTWLAVESEKAPGDRQEA